MSERSLVVLKFGSSVLRSQGDLPIVASEIKRHVDEGSSVLAVVSAIGTTTESLIGQAGALGHALGPFAAAAGSTAGATTDIGASGPAGCTSTLGDRALAALLGTGEEAAAALVGLALDGVGIKFSLLDVGRVGPFTRGPQLDAQPHAFDSGTVRRALAVCPVAILPGFVGRDMEGNFSLLGRGGSDLSALFAARSLDAHRCRLLKDVDGVYEYDPCGATVKPRRYASLNWEDTLRVDGNLLQRKAVQFAYRHRIPFEVGACGGCRGTRVGSMATSLRRLAS